MLRETSVKIWLQSPQKFDWEKIRRKYCLPVEQSAGFEWCDGAKETIVEWNLWVCDLFSWENVLGGEFTPGRKIRRSCIFFLDKMNMEYHP